MAVFVSIWICRHKNQPIKLVHQSRDLGVNSVLRQQLKKIQ